MVEAVSHWPLIALAPPQIPASSFGTYSQQSGNGTAFSPHVLWFWPVGYLSTNSPNSFICH